MSEKLLISIEDVTPLRGMERIQEIFFVFLGYDVSGNAIKAPLAVAENPLLERITPQDANLTKWFYMGASPVIQMRKGRVHVFPGGYPVFYGEPGDIVSFYLAIIESDRGARQIGEIMKEVTSDISANPLIDAAATLAGTAAPQVALVKEAFGLLIKGVEAALINNRDDIRYTNVLTFRKREEYLRGSHSDWGNQRVAFTLESEM